MCVHGFVGYSHFRFLFCRHTGPALAYFSVPLVSVNKYVGCKRGQHLSFFTFLATVSTSRRACSSSCFISLACPNPRRGRPRPCPRRLVSLWRVQNRDSDPIPLMVPPVPDISLHCSRINPLDKKIVPGSLYWLTSNTTSSVDVIGSNLRTSTKFCF